MSFIGFIIVVKIVSCKSQFYRLTSMTCKQCMHRIHSVYTAPLHPYFETAVFLRSYGKGDYIIFTEFIFYQTKCNTVRLCEEQAHIGKYGWSSRFSLNILVLFVPLICF